MVSTRDWQTRLEESRNLTVARLAEIARPAAAHDRPDLGIPFVAPRNQLEKTIAGIWQEVLGIARVGVEDDFLELGGHSLLATQVLSRLRQTLNVELPIRSFFEASTIAELSRAVEEHSDDGDGTPFVEIQEGTI